MDKRFIEESFPVKEVSIEAAREKNLRYGYISTLHLWWARKPLASSRSTNYAALIPCPNDEIDWIKKKNFIIEISKWKNSLNYNLLQKAKQDIIKANNGKIPKVLDPFSGGGSIPLESMRIGCDTYSGDYNPVAILIEKCTLEFPQLFGKKLLADIEKWGNRIYDSVKEEIADFYPKVFSSVDNYNTSSDGSDPVGYIWFNTIKCQNPSCELEIPLTTQFWLCKKNNKFLALYPILRNKKIEFKIVGNKKNRNGNYFDPTKGTISRAIVKCPSCGYTIDAKSVKNEFKKGNSSQILAAVISREKGKKGKIYSLPSQEDINSYKKAEDYLNQKIEILNKEWGFSPIPDEEIPKSMTGCIAPPNYGMNTWGDIFNSRQKLSILLFIEKIKNLYNILRKKDYEEDYSIAIVTYLALCVDRLVDYGSKLCILNHTGGRGVKNTFSRPALPIVWNYMESNPLDPVAAGWLTALEKTKKWIEHSIGVQNKNITVKQFSAVDLPYKNNYFDAVFTDPPYYNAIPYADLSDFFYVWLKRIIGDLYPELFITPLTPKSNEIVENAGWDKERYFYKDKKYFESELKKSFKEIYRVLKNNGICTIVYAHKTTEGWETVINALLDSGLTVTASWPISTEMRGRSRAQKSAALASSIYIVARKFETKETGWFKEVKDEIMSYVPQKLDRLWDEGISGADFFITAIGSSIEIFGKYDRVLDNEGKEVRADKIISFVRDVVANYTMRQILHNGIADELSPLTKFYLMWRWNYQEVRVPFDEARKLAQSAGIDLTNEWNKGFIVKFGEFIIVQGPDKRDKKSLEDSIELIDILHYVCLLWKEGKRDEIKLVLKKSGYGEGEALYKVAQAISETLPTNSSEKKMIEGFLASKDRMHDMREDNSQTKLV